MITENKIIKAEKKVDITHINKLAKRNAEEVASYLEGKWCFQNDEQDKKTNFIYQSDVVEDILYEHSKYKNFDLNYAMQRFYNYLTSTRIENIFCSYDGCEPEKDKRNKEVDFWLYEKPFDLKVTSFPKKFPSKREDFKSDRMYRNELIKWFYENQSKEKRNLNQNRIFLVCQDGDGKVQLKNQLLKKEFLEIDLLIQKFMNYHLAKKNENEENIFNTVTIDGKEVLSDIIFLKK
jgi:hypothetical protein